MKPTKKSAKKKTRINAFEHAFDTVCDLVDAHLDEELTKDELIEKLMKVIGKPIIEISEVKYIVTEWENNIYLESKQEGQDDWVQVEDLTELRVWEYNELVDKLQKHYPDYPIEYLEGRFV